MKLAITVAGACGICGVSAAQHRRCAVCEGSNQLVRICAFCTAWHRAQGVEWNTRAFDSDDEARPATALRDAMAPTRGRGRPRSARIDDLVLPALLTRRERVRVLRIDYLGRRRGSYWRWTYPSRREIARRVGCSQHAVDRRLRDYTRPRRPVSRASFTRDCAENMK